MQKKKLILADADELYLMNLSNYFMEKNPQLELNIFTVREKLLEYLEQGGKADILAVDEATAANWPEHLGQGMTKVMLSAGGPETPGFAAVKKYQKSETLLNEILLKHAEFTGTIEAIKGNYFTKICAFYSPEGGSGKTSLSLALSAACAAKGMKVLYLNLEEIDSVSDVLEPTAGSLSDVFLALKTSGMNAGIKLSGSVGAEQFAGFHYLSGVDSISEYEEISGEDITNLFQVIRSLAEYQWVIVDIASGFYEKTLAVLKQADLIFTPIRSDECSIAKLNRFLAEERIHNQYDSILEKMYLVANQAAAAGVSRELSQSGLLNRLACSAVIPASPLFLRRADILRSAEVLKQMLEPLMQTMAQAGQ